MSRVLLISANTCVDPYPVFPLGMATVAAALMEAGHEVLQFDWLAAGEVPQTLSQALATFGPDVVAVSIRNLDRVDSMAESAEGWELRGARDVIALLRQQMDVPIVVGGPAVSIMPREVRAYVGADVAVVGEGERSIVEVVEAAAQDGSLPEVWPGGSERLSGVGQRSPCLDPSLVSFYWNASGILGLQTKRGCSYHCCYCTYPGLEGPCFRPRPTEAVVTDMERLKRDFQVDTVFFADSVFNDPAGHYLELAEALARRELGVKWAAYFSPKGMDREAVALCRRAGLYAVELGVDAASDATLHGMGKAFTWADAREATDMLSQSHVACAQFIIFGGPDETAETVEEGLNNIAALESCVVFGFSGIRIYPGTPLHRRALAEGVVQKDESLFEPVYYIAPTVDKAWMDRRLTEAWARRPDRVFPPQRGYCVTAKLRSLGWKGLLWERLIARWPSETTSEGVGDAGTVEHG